MDKRQLKELLEKVASGEVSVEDATLSLRSDPIKEVAGHTKIDMHRGIRQGNSEVIYGAGKTPEQIREIAKAMLNEGEKTILVTRITPEKAAELDRDLPFSYNEVARCGIFGTMPKPDGAGIILVASGGTSDVPVSEEAAYTAEVMGNKVVRLFDVGVAGIHRLLSHTDDIMKARCIVAVAGMEGALPSVIGGLVDVPVIAVPTSVGYGASLGGISALLAMLNSCASGVSVVNIDNGFGAGYLAGLINHL